MAGGKRIGGHHPGKFRKRQNTQAHITVIYVRISRSGESVDGLLLWRKREKKIREGGEEERTDILPDIFYTYKNGRY